MFYEGMQLQNSARAKGHTGQVLEEQRGKAARFSSNNFNLNKILD
jgi:hypothetical protein